MGDVDQHISSTPQCKNIIISTSECGLVLHSAITDDSGFDFLSKKDSKKDVSSGMEGKVLWEEL